MNRRLALRALLLALLLASLFDLRWPFGGGRPTVIAAVDVSKSVDAAATLEALDMVRQLEQLEDTELRLIAFADRPVQTSSVAELGQLPVYDREYRLPPQPDGRVWLDRSRTNLERAVDQALQLLPRSEPARLLLVSDGVATDGDVRALLPTLHERGVPVFTVPAPTADAEPAIVDLELPPGGVVAGRPFRARVHVASARDEQRVLRVRAEAQPWIERRLELTPGRHLVDVELTLREPGRQPLALQIEQSDSRWRALVEVSPAADVLVVEGGEGTSPVWAALAERGWNITRVAPERMSAERLRQLDPAVVVLSDLEAPRLDESVQEALARWVHEQGGGLLFACGPSIYGEDGWAGSPLETVLPLRFRLPEEETEVALIIALDKSYSMKGEKIELAKEATKAALGELEDHHFFGVVAFDWNTFDVVPLQVAEQRTEIEERISRIEASAQTNFFPALESALRQLEEIESEVKHVILISDGKTYPDDYESLLRRIREAEITVSTVAVGEEADRELLGQIADWGKGQSYFVRDAARVQRILLSEAQRKRDQSLVEEATTVQIARQSPVLAGLPMDSLPPLDGFVALENRDEAHIVLATPDDKPILAARSVGLGRTWTFASDLKQRWATPWLRWPGFAELISQVLLDAAAPRLERNAELELERHGDQLRLLARARTNSGRPADGLDLVVRANGSGESSDFALEQIAPGLYRGSLYLRPDASEALWFELRQSGRDQVLDALSFYYPRRDEALPLPANDLLLQELAVATGGTFEPTLEQLLESPGDRLARAQPLRPWLLFAALLVYLLDLLLHRTGRLDRPEELAIEAGVAGSTDAGGTDDGISPRSPFGSSAAT